MKTREEISVSEQIAHAINRAYKQTTEMKHGNFFASEAIRAVVLQMCTVLNSIDPEFDADTFISACYDS